MFRLHLRQNSKLNKRLNAFTIIILLTTLFLGAFSQVPIQAIAADNSTSASEIPVAEQRTTTSIGNQKLPSLVPQITLPSTQVNIGETVTATITVTNFAPYEANDLKLDLTIPASISMGEKEATSGNATKTGWQWTQPILKGNTTETFTATLTVSSMPPGEALLLEAQVTSKEIERVNPAFGGAVVVDPAIENTPAVTSFVPGQDAKLKADAEASKNANVKSGVEVNFGAKSYSKPLTLKKLSASLKEPELKAKGANIPPKRASLKNGFESFYLEAQDEQSKAVTQFDAPVTISLHYTPEQLAALHITEDDLTLFWYDDVHEYFAEDGKTKLPGKWVAIDTALDRDNKTAIAEVNHFSTYQFADGSSASSAFVPSLQGFQDDLYTGGASYSYSLDIPVGPGGIKPSLNLSYSSTATDGPGGARIGAQAGWVGKGWSLGTSSISLNKVGEGSNYYTLVLDGRSYDITKGSQISTNSFNWNSVNEDYIKVISLQNGNSYTGSPGRGGFDTSIPRARIKWQVWDKNGTLYEFAEDMWWGWVTTCASWATFEPYKFMLTKVVDTHGNTINYNYDRVTNSTLTSGCYGVSGYADRDIWPTSITWGGNQNTGATDRFKVQFNSSVRTNDGYLDVADGQYGPAPLETRQLNNLTVWSMQGSTWQMVRGYGFGHDYSLYSDGDSPTDATQPSAYRRLTLTSITRYGSDATLDGSGNISGTSLPATTFTYQLTRGTTAFFPNGGWNRLIGVNNGQGGTITLAYANIGTIVLTWNNKDFRNNHRLTSKTISDGMGNSYTWQYTGYADAAYNTLGKTIAGNWYGPSDNTNSAVLYYNKYYEGYDRTNFLVHAPMREFRGHSYVKVTAPDGTQTEHWFYQGFADCGNPTAIGVNLINDACFLQLRDRELLKGKEYRTRVLGPSPTNTVYSDTFNTYTVGAFFNYGYNGLWRNFTYQSQTDVKTYEGQATPMVKTTKYYYDAVGQAGTQYGNMTRTEEYDGTSLVRSTNWYFNPLNNGTSYIVNKPREEWILDATGRFLAFTQYLYDNQTTHGTFGTKGDVTLTRKYTNLPLVTGPTIYPLQGTDTTTSYDAYGNPTGVTTYSSPGLTTFSSGSWILGTPGNGSTATTTTTAYDTTFHTYSISTTNPTVSGVTLQEQAGYDLRMGLMTSITDPNGQVSNAEYDVFGRMVKMYKPGDTSAIPTQTYNYYDWMIPFRYITSQQIDSGVSGSNHPTTIFYDGMGRKIQIKEQSAALQNIVTDQNYDAFGHVTQSSQARFVAETSGTFWSFTARDTNTIERWTTTTYDPLGRAYNITAPDGTLMGHRYLVNAETSGQMTLRDNVIDANRHRTQQRYDALGRLVYAAEFSGDCGQWEYTCAAPYTTNWSNPVATTTYNYSPLDQLTGVTDQPGNQTKMIYDSLGRKLYMQDPDMGAWSYSYDADGNLVKQTDAKGQSVNFTYDALNRLTSKTTQAAPTQTFADTFDTKDNTNWTYNNSYQTVPYNDTGNNVVKHAGISDYSSNFYRSSYSLSSGNSLQVRFKVDNANASAHFGIEANDATYRRFAVIVGNGGKLQAQYINGSTNIYPAGADILPSVQLTTWYVLKFNLDDSNGFSVEVYQENNPTNRGYYTNSTFPTGKSWRFHQWSAAGNTYIDDYKEFNSASPVTVGTYGYDSVTAVNGKGQRTSMSNANSTTTWKYDARARVTDANYSSITGLSGDRLFQYTYFADDTTNTMVYPSLSDPGNASASDREILTYSYNPQRSQTGVCTSLGGCYASGATYNALNQVTQETFGNGLKQTWTYNSPMSRLQQLQVGTSASLGSLFDRSYTYDNVSNIKTITNNKNTQVQTFGYDYLDRLTSASATPVSGDSGYSETYSYDTIGNLLTKPNNTVSYVYPTAGQAHPHAPSSVSGQSYTYDANGNLVSGGGRSYTWDVENKPTGIISTGSLFTAESYLYDAEGERLSRTVGATTTVYLNGVWEEEVGGVRRAQYQFNEATIAQRDSTGAVIYMHGDHLGSVSLVTNSSGSVVSQQEFDPWGKVRSGGVSQTANNYTGQKLDGSGLLYYHARYYDPVLGKFVSPDSIVPGTASGEGGAAITLGIDEKVELRPLTVDFHKIEFLTELRAEISFTQNKGFLFKPEVQALLQAKIPWGPENPQSLNRFAYVLNNPLRFIDPTGNITEPTPEEEAAWKQANPKTRDAEFLKKQGLDPHTIKNAANLGEPISRFDIATDGKGNVYLVRKSNGKIVKKLGYKTEVPGYKPPSSGGGGGRGGGGRGGGPNIGPGGGKGPGYMFR